MRLELDEESLNKIIMCMPIRMIIAGGREFASYGMLVREMRKLPIPDLIICGMAPGTDMLGHRYAKSRGIPILEMPADWKDLTKRPCRVRSNAYGKYNALAGNNRNMGMSKIGTHYICFWDGKSTGTRDMISQSVDQGLEIKIIRY